MLVIVVVHRGMFSVHAFISLPSLSLPSSTRLLLVVADPRATPTNGGRSWMHRQQQRLFMGGYDATVINNPNNLPIQFYARMEEEGDDNNQLCPYSARTHILLLELGLDFDKFDVIGKPDWYLKKISPNGILPSIRNPSDNNLIVYGSTIMNEYLCEHSADGSLLPSTPSERVKLRLLNKYFDTTIGALFKLTTTLVTSILSGSNDNPELKTRNEVILWDLQRRLEYYETILEENNDDDDDDDDDSICFLMGNNQFTLADIHLIPFIHRIIITDKEFNNKVLSKDKYPKLLKWYENCLQRESIKQVLLLQQDQNQE